MLQTLNKIVRIGIISERTPPLAERAEIGALQKKIRSIFGRALCIRHVDAGSCNGCELEIHALSNPYYNLEGLGIKFVASPRHADLLLVTGPASRHMEGALRRTYAAIPDPRWVIALGDCGSHGGPFGCSYACIGAVADIIPVDATVPGCPPTPTLIIAAILAVLNAPRTQCLPESREPG